MRRNSHERHSLISVPRPVGRANNLFRRQSHPAGWRRISRPRASSSRAHRDANITARTRERRVTRTTCRRADGRGGPRPVSERPESFAGSWFRKSRPRLIPAGFVKSRSVVYRHGAARGVHFGRGDARDRCGISRGQRMTTCNRFDYRLFNPLVGYTFQMGESAFGQLCDVRIWRKHTGGDHF